MDNKGTKIMKIRKHAKLRKTKRGYHVVYDEFEGDKPKTGLIKYIGLVNHDTACSLMWKFMDELEPKNSWYLSIDKKSRKKIAETLACPLGYGFCYTPDMNVQVGETLSNSPSQGDYSEINGRYVFDLLPETILTHRHDKGCIVIVAGAVSDTDIRGRSIIHNPIVVQVLIRESLQSNWVAR